MKSRTELNQSPSPVIQHKTTFTPEQKWAIAAAIIPGVPLGLAAGHINLIMTSTNWFMNNREPVFARSFGRAYVGFCQKQGFIPQTIPLFKTPYFSVPFATTVALCATAGFFAKKNYSEWRRCAEERKNSDIFPRKVTRK